MIDGIERCSIASHMVIDHLRYERNPQLGQALKGSELKGSPAFFGWDDFDPGMPLGQNHEENTSEDVLGY